MPMDKRRWFGLAVLALGVAIIIVDATIVNVAIPSIIEELGIDLVEAEWVNTIYSLVFAALLITLGKTGDLYGRKRLFHAGIIVFTLASALAGQAPSAGWLIGARTLQGVGAAMILPATLSMVNATFQGRDRAIAFGIWGSVIGGMAALGPLLGGWLTTEHSWRWAFYINIPIGAVVILGSLLFVTDSRDETAARGFDVVGVISVSLGLTSLVFGLIEGARYGWWAPTDPFAIGSWEWPFATLSPVPFAFAVALTGLVVFVRTELRRRQAGLPVLFDLGLFRLRSFRNGNIAGAILALGEFGLIFILPLFLQAVLGYTAFRTGLLLVALAMGAFLGGPSAAGLAHRFGPRRVVSAGMGLEAVAIFAIGVVISPTVANSTLVPILFVYGIGVGLASAQLTSTILAEVPPGESGQASGMQSTFRQVGSALGIALLGTVLAVNLGSATSEALADVPGLPAVAAEGIAEAMSSSAGQALNGFRAQPDSEAVVAAASQAFADAAQRASQLATVFVVFGFLVSLRLPDLKGYVREDDAGSVPMAGESS